MDPERILLAAALVLGFPAVTYGLAATLSFSRILARPRAWACGVGRSVPNRAQMLLAALLSCMFCTGMWTGGAYGVLAAAVGAVPWPWAPIVVGVAAPAGAASAYLLDLVARRLEAGLPE